MPVTPEPHNVSFLSVMTVGVKHILFTVVLLDLL